MRSKSLLRAAVLVLLGLAVATSPAHAHQGIDAQVADLTRRIAAERDSGERALLFLRRGELHGRRREWAAAGADFARARELDAGLDGVDLAVGRMWLDGGNAVLALAALDRFLARRPESVKGLVTRARAFEELGQHLAAAEDYGRAIALVEPPARPLPEHYLGRARALAVAGRGRAEDAVRVLDDGLERLGGPITLELAAIDLELELGRTEAALARIDRVLARAARKEGWLARRGEILEQAGRVRAAREAFARALAAVEELPETRRRTRATARIEESARAALERLREETTETRPGRPSAAGKGADR